MVLPETDHFDQFQTTKEELLARDTGDIRRLRSGEIDKLAGLLMLEQSVCEIVAEKAPFLTDSGRQDETGDIITARGIFIADDTSHTTVLPERKIIFLSKVRVFFKKEKNS